MQTRYFDLRDTKGQQKEIEDKIGAAAKILRDGGLVGIPTETVYGLGANALDGTAVKRIFEAKGRPQDNPLIIHVTGAQWLPRYCADVPPLAYVLARKFWPGPLTMILKRRPIIPDETTAGLDTVAVRCPNHPVTLAIIREAGIPIAAPSANLSGRPSCTTAQDVLEDMDGRISGVVDGGPCAVGVESTILDLTCDPPRLLRPGGLPLEDLERLIGKIDVDKAVNGALAEGEKPKAPGMKYRHYAPKAPVTVITGAPEKSAQEILRRVGPTSGVICFEEFADLFREQEVHTLGPAGDKLVQAQRVFDALRTFDTSDVTEIFAQCPDNRGLGLAIGNRLKKAAGFHVVEADSERVVLGLTGGTGAGKSSALRAIRVPGGRGHRLRRRCTMRCWRPALPCGMRSASPSPARLTQPAQLDRQQAGTGGLLPQGPAGAAQRHCGPPSGAGGAAALGSVGEQDSSPSMPSTCWRAGWTSCATGRWPSPRPWSCGSGGSWPGTTSQSSTPACGSPPSSRTSTTGASATVS